MVHFVHLVHSIAKISLYLLVFHEKNPFEGETRKLFIFGT